MCVGVGDGPRSIGRLLCLLSEGNRCGHMKENFISKIAFSVLPLLEAFSDRNSHVIIHHAYWKVLKLIHWDIWCLREGRSCGGLRDVNRIILQEANFCNNYMKWLVWLFHNPIRGKRGKKEDAQALKLLQCSVIVQNILDLRKESRSHHGLYSKILNYYVGMFILPPPPFTTLLLQTDSYHQNIQVEPTLPSELFLRILFLIYIFCGGC